MARVDIPRTNLRERRLRRRRILAVLIAILIVLILAAGVGLTWLPFIRIETIDVEGQKTISNDDIVQSVQNDLYGGYLHLFARSNIFLYPKGAIQKQLLSLYPTLASVDVHAGPAAGGLHTLVVSLVEREPKALWCGEAAASSSSCYLIDQSGIVYAPAVVYSGDAYQKYYGAVVGASLPQRFLDGGQFHSLTSLVDALQTKETMRVQTVAVDAGDARITFENSFTLIIATNDDTGDLFERFALALQATPFTTHPLSDFEYLDLRFGDKLYYKLKSD